MGLVIVLTVATDVGCAFILFLMYFASHKFWEKEKNVSKLEQLSLTLLICASLLVVTNVIFFFRELRKLASLCKRKKLFGKANCRLYIYASLTMLLISVIQAALASIVMSIFLGVYFCEIKGRHFGPVCALDSDFAFGIPGFYLMGTFLALYLMCLPRLTFLCVELIC